MMPEANWRPWVTIILCGQETASNAQESGEKIRRREKRQRKRNQMKAGNQATRVLCPERDRRRGGSQRNKKLLNWGGGGLNEKGKFSYYRREAQATGDQRTRKEKNRFIRNTTRSQEQNGNGRLASLGRNERSDLPLDLV